MTTAEILTQLEAFGNEGTRKVYLKHGAREPFFGVKVADLKTIVKKVKKNHKLALELYDTGNSDAMYLAGLIADETKMTKANLQHWLDNAYWYMLSEYTVPWVAAETPYGHELALEWITSDEERVASAGWSTLSSIVSLKPNEKLEVGELAQFLDHIQQHIHDAQNRVKYTMNGFIIAVGTYVPTLTDKALAIAEAVGKVSVDMGGTACKVPLAGPYIQKSVDKGRIGKKRKQARC